MVQKAFGETWGVGTAYDVLRYPLRPGRTDDQRIQLAIDEAASDAGGPVYIPAGTYTLADELVLPENTHLIADMNATILGAGDHSLLRITRGCFVEGGYWMNENVTGETPIVYAKAEGGALWGRRFRQGLSRMVIQGDVNGSDREGIGLLLQAADDGASANAVQWLSVSELWFNELSKGVSLTAAEDASGSPAAYVNGNVFDRLYFDQCVKAVHADVTANSGSVSGNLFSNLTIQCKSVTTHGVHLADTAGTNQVNRNRFTNVNLFDAQGMSGLGSTAFTLQTESVTDTRRANHFVNVTGTAQDEYSLAGADDITPAMAAT